MTYFVIHSDPVGYYSQGAKPNWKRMKTYHAWKKAVQLTAKSQGVRLPLRASKDRPVHITTRAFFRNGVHPDPENVHKGIVDAMFYDPRKERRGSDKHTGGFFQPPLYDSKHPRVEVWIEEVSAEHAQDRCLHEKAIRKGEPWICPDCGQDVSLLVEVEA